MERGNGVNTEYRPRTFFNSDTPAPVPRRRKDEDEVRRERPGMREQEIKKYKPDLTPTNLNSKSDSDSSCDLRRTSSGYYSSASENGGSNSSRKPEDIKDSSRRLEDSKKNKPDLKNVKPKIDTGLGIKKSASQTRIPENPVPPPLQKRSEPNLSKHRKFSGSFKVPDLPPTSTFTRNTGNRRSLTRLFLRNGDNRKVDKGSGGDIKTPFGVCKETPELEEVNCKRSNFLNKRSITSLSLFNRKEDEPSSGQDNKERKNSFSRIRAARSSLDLSSIGLGSLSRASSKSTLSELKEESCEKGERKHSDRPWFDLTRVWKDQTKDLPTDEMLQKMRKERSGRAKTVPTGLGDSLEPNSSQDVPDGLSSLPPCQTTPSTLKKTVHLLSPEVLTNWYEKRKKVESLYGGLGPRRNSVSNLFFHPDKKQSSPLAELKNSDKMRKSMLNLEDLHSGDLSSGSGKGVQRSESAKLSSDRNRWRGKGIQRSESARLITMRQSPLQQRQNSHPSLVQQQSSYSSSSSSLADRSSLESPSKLTTCSLSNNDPFFADNPNDSDSDLEAEADPPDWRHSLTAEELSQLSAKELKRQDVINELFHTEKSHVRNLKVLESVFRQPLVEKGRMSKELSNKLFANLDQVLALHQKYNTAMKSRVKNGFPVRDIGDILTDMFLDGNGDTLVKVVGEFIKNQNFTIEELKRTRSRDTKLELFLSELERKPACRRLQLQSMLPMEHQRLVKYPLLLEQIAKYSDTPESCSEHDIVVSAMEKTKDILDSIDRLVAQQQNKERLSEIQLNIDTSGLDKLGSDNPIYKEYKSLDLTKHVLVYDGLLTLKLGDTKRLKQLHVVLLEDCMMLLQKQGDKYLLKFHNNQSQGGESRRSFHSPIIKFSTMLVRPVATDKRAFYLLNTTECGPQIYELLAGSTSERTRWIKHITEVSNAYKSRDGVTKTKSEPEQLGGSVKEKQDLRSQSFRDPTGSPRMSRADRQNSSPPECPLTSPESEETKPEPSSPDSGASTPSAPKKRLQRVEILKIVDSEPMIEPSQVRVNQTTVLMADPVITPFEKLRQKDEELNRILGEKQKLIAEILQVPEEDFEIISDIAGSADHKRDVREVLLAALAQARSLTQVVSASLKVTEQDLVARSSPSRDTPLHPGYSGNQLVQITSTMNQNLTELLTLLQEREQERDLLKRELSRYQDQVKGFLRSDSLRSFPSPVPRSRPISFISVESDPMDLESDPRPQSFNSVELDTQDCPGTEEELSHEDEYQNGEDPSSPLPGQDSDLTPTEERVSDISEPGPGQIQIQAYESKPWILNEMKDSSKEWTPDQEETSA